MSKTKTPWPTGKARPGSLQPVCSACSDCGLVPDVTEEPYANVWNRWRLLHLCDKTGRGLGIWCELQGAEREYVVRRWNFMNSKKPPNDQAEAPEPR